jgi:hypothetical protein
MTIDGAAQPVIVSTIAPDGGPATPVAVVTGETPNGGPAMPVIEVADGRPVVGAVQRISVVADGRAVQGRKPMPVVVVSGSLSPTTVMEPFDYTLGGTQTLFAGFIGWRTGAFWRDAAQTVAAGVGDPIESWREIYSGANRHATQAVLARKPTAVLASTNRLGASFDGIDDALQTAAFADVAQPTMLYTVTQRVLPIGAVRDNVYDGVVGTKRQLMCHMNGTSVLRFFSGTSQDSAVVSVAMDVMTARFDGATSWLWRNGVAILGPVNVGALALSGVTLGAAHDLSGPFGGHILAYLGYPGVHTDAQRNAIIAALTAEAGI